MKHSPDYHDYVFKNGKLIGKFNDMYKYSKEVPWHQDKSHRFSFSDIDIAILKQYKYDTICDIGCGLRYFSTRLYKELRSNQSKHPNVSGIDISEEAIQKAKSLFPYIRFIKSDLLKNRPLKDEYFDLVMIKEVLWYVCHKLKLFLHNVVDMSKDNGFLFISLAFPETNKWVGKNTIYSPEKLKAIFLQYTKPVHYCIEYDWNISGRPYFHFLGRVQKA